MNQPTLFDSKLEPETNTPFRDVKYLVCKRYKQDISKREIKEVYLLGTESSIMFGGPPEHIGAKIVNPITGNEFRCFNECVFNTFHEAEYAKNNHWIYKD
jgi:hypothetical protein